jgi:hypothetical protein
VLANVLVFIYSKSDDGDLHVKLGDFGLAKDRGEAVSDTYVGTLDYMAPVSHYRTASIQEKFIDNYARNPDIPRNFSHFRFKQPSCQTSGPSEVLYKSITEIQQLIESIQ